MPDPAPSASFSGSQVGAVSWGAGEFCLATWSVAPARPPCWGPLGHSGSLRVRLQVKSLGLGEAVCHLLRDPLGSAPLPARPTERPVLETL